MARKRYDEVYEVWKDYIGIPWWREKKAIGGCYDIILKFYKEQFGMELFDYPSEKKYLFKPEYIEAESPRQGGSTVVYTGRNDESFDMNIMEFGDVMIMHLFIDPLGGGYRVDGKRLCNHIGIYLGEGWMLHHPYQCESDIVDLHDDNCSWYLTNTELVLRKV